MTTLALQRDFGARSSAWLPAAFALVIVLQLELVFNRPVNWDEFHHLSQAHAFIEGRLTEALQVFYARAFFWIALLPIDLVDQIRLARMFMFGCELFTTYAIYAVACHFTERRPAAFTALAYLTTGYVLQHGFSYRADPMAAALLMGSLWILVASRLDKKAVLAAATLAALAWLTTIKVVLYAPAFAGIAWWRWQNSDRSAQVLLRIAALAGVAALLALAFTALTIATLPQGGAGTAERTVSASGARMFSEGLFPQWPYIAGAVASAPVMALLIATAPLEMFRTRMPKPQRVALIGLLLPLASVALYRNSFPYFYVFILPPAMIAAAIAARSMLAMLPERLLLIALVLGTGFVSLATPREVLSRQQQVISAVHRIFPQPVSYFDFPGIVADYPKANFFMSTWGVTQYWRGSTRTFVDAMTRQTVPLLIADHELLERNQTAPEPAWELLPRDAAALRENFVHHWGPIWVAGRRFPATAPAQDFRVYAPGTYTLEGAAARIDGRAVKPGATLEMSRGMHRFERIEKGEVVLRWGDHLLQPADSYLGGPVFKDF